MKLVFAGTPTFAAVILSALINAGTAAGLHLVAVYTQPDRRAGRGRKVRASAVKTLATAHNLNLRQPSTLRNESDAISGLAPDLLITAAYGLLLPAAVLAAPRLGCVNVHPSLLPRWRGAAPVARAVEAGDTVSGVTLMLMNEGLDRGDVLANCSLNIEDEETAGALSLRLAKAGAELLLGALPQMKQHIAARTAQDDADATYADKVSNAEARINWHEPADVIARKVRAFNPAPGAWCEWRGKRLHIHAARVMDDGSGGGAPGTVLPGGIDDELNIATGDGGITILALQRSGGRSMCAAEFKRGAQLKPGQQLQ